MGIPHFYGWANYKFRSRFYKILANKIKGLYIDGNSIIHDAVNYIARKGIKKEGKSLWREIFKRIVFLLIEALTLTKPSDIFVLAIDGVVPAAKLNQQRIRRHAKNVDDTDKLNCDDELNGKKKTEDNPTPMGFDRNIISPGTPFMDYIDRKLREWLDEEYSKPEKERILPYRVIYYSHRTPGEGEHKLFEAMEHGHEERPVLFGSGGVVAGRKEERKYNVIYGNDADLIVLGIIRGNNIIVMRPQPRKPLPTQSRELSRGRNEKYRGTTGTYEQQAEHDPDDGDIDLEELGFSSSEDDTDINNKDTPKDERIFDYINCSGIRYDLSQTYGMTNCQDLLFISLFVGNDFMPPLQACYDLRSALNKMLDLYSKMVASLSTFKLVEGGTINWDYAWKFIKQMGEPIGDVSISREAKLLIDRSMLEQSGNYNGTQYLQDAVTATAKGVFLINMAEYEESYLNHIFGGDEVMSLQYNESEKWGDIVKKDNNMVNDMCTTYINTMFWVVNYYLKGASTIDVSWYYPYHYAPLFSQLAVALRPESRPTSLAGIRMLTINTPFMNPLEQLLCILPKPSLLSILYNNVTEESSEYDQIQSEFEDILSLIQDFFPIHIEKDGNGIRYTEQYRYTVLLPFASINRAKIVAQSIGNKEITARGKIFELPHKA